MYVNVLEFVYVQSCMVKNDLTSKGHMSVTDHNLESDYIRWIISHGCLNE